MTAGVHILQTGAANLASVIAAMERLGLCVRLTTDPATVRECEACVLPGVGAFGPAMRQLRAHGLDTALRERVRAGLPLLAICLGMQLLFEASEESPGEAGLALFPGNVTRFANVPRVPHMGWNTIKPSGTCTIVRPMSGYFANSYRIESMPAECSGAVCAYGGSFVAAIEQGPLLACQFHPELSGGAGAQLLSRWYDRASSARGGASC